MTEGPTSTSARHRTWDDSATLVHAAMIARRFYLGGETKQEIGRQLGISRFKVARLLDLANDRGMVHIEIDSPGGFNLDLADTLRERFDLTEVWVVNLALANGEDDHERLGIAAAPIVAELIQPDEVVGIGWGRTLSALVDRLPSFEAATIVQIAGGVSSPYGESPSDLPRRLGERFHKETFILHAPLFVKDPATAEALRSDATTAVTLAQLGRLTTALIGVGAWERDQPAIAQTLSDSDTAELESAGVVAHSLPLFFTRDGHIISDGTAERTIGITYGELQAVPRRIGIGGGRSKAVSLEALLNTGLVTHLVTDVTAAEAVVSAHR